MFLTSSRIRLGAFALIVGLAGALQAPAQVFYQAVQAQHQYNGQTYYYGGHHAAIVDHARRDIDRTCYTSAVTQVPVVDRQRIYSDRVPFENLADNSYTSYRTWTAADAQNEANANVPLYFRKRDLLRAAVLDTDGTLVVPADAVPRVDIRVRVPASMVPAVEKGMILIIPKKLLKPQPKDGPAVAMND